MRGGALAPFAWALLLAVLGTINAIWTGDGIQIGTFGFAVLAIVTLSASLVLRSSEARRRGPPEPRAEPLALPTVSVGAVVVALGIGSIVFGLAFGHFPIYFGAGLVVAGIGRLALELRAQRSEIRRWRSR